MIGFAGALISLVVLQAWGDAIDGRSLWVTWSRSTTLVGALLVIAAGGITLGRLLK